MPSALVSTFIDAISAWKKTTILRVTVYTPSAFNLGCGYGWAGET